HHSTVAFEHDRQWFTWRNAFLTLNRLVGWYERLGCTPLRRRSLRLAERWLLEHLERSDGLAAIYPAMMNAIFALLALGRTPADPLTARQIDRLRDLEIDDGMQLQLQPCVSPVWDTAIAMVAVEETGATPHDGALVKAARWLLERHIAGPGDWQGKTPAVKPGGWAVEFPDAFYPDVDGTDL